MIDVSDERQAQIHSSTVAILHDKNNEGVSEREREGGRDIFHTLVSKRAVSVHGEIETI